LYRARPLKSPPPHTPVTRPSNRQDSGFRGTGVDASVVAMTDYPVRLDGELDAPATAPMTDACPPFRLEMGEHETTRSVTHA
jgi:hypothetical protein